MLPDLQFDRLTVVLVSPRNPLNIGAGARAMANFGFSRLTVVAPYEPHWREARSAVGAENLLQNATRVEHLAEAVADCTLVLGTGTLAHRKPEQPIVPLPNLGPIIETELARGGRIALVFGSEKHGLTREDLALCHHLVEIPTDSRQPSMNLGQAVAVCLYELAARIPSARDRGPTRADPASADPAIADPAPPTPAHRENNSSSAASARQLELLAGVVEDTMMAADYSPAAMRQANRHDLQLMLHRLALAPQDARRILGLFRKILWRLKHTTNTN